MKKSFDSSNIFNEKNKKILDDIDIENDSDLKNVNLLNTDNNTILNTNINTNEKNL